MRKLGLWNSLKLAVLMALASGAVQAELPSEQQINSQLQTAKADKSGSAEINTLVQNLEGTLSLLAQIKQQQETNAKLNEEVANADAQTKESLQNLDKLKNQSTSTSLAELQKQPLEQLQAQAEQVQQNLQQVQTDLSLINANLVAQRSVPERAQSVLTDNLARTQQINKLMFSNLTSPSLKGKFEAELALIDLKNSYNQALLNANDSLTALYTSQLEEKNLYQQRQQAQLADLQEAINAQYLQESAKQVAQATKTEQQNEQTNPVLAQELATNTSLSQDLLNQTKYMNSLSQDNLRIKNVLDNLQQTQRNIDEQISALQGTLVLSRIINKQKQLLPQDTLIKGLSKRIADLRVKIFDMTEMRDRIYDTDSYIANLEKNEKITFSAKERSQLVDILQDRFKLLADLIKQLNNQLNLSINIELNQRQVSAISDTLQDKLQQQSFWVRSNPPIDMQWFADFLPTASAQLKEIGKKFNFSNWRENLLPASLSIGILLALTGLILWRKETIKAKLSKINSKINSLKNDSQWHTPKAIFWTIVLCLPSTFMFLACLLLVSYLCLDNPLSYWNWNLKMSCYWLFFAFMLAMLRPNGLAYRHFNMPKESNETFREVLKRSVWVVALLLNTSIFTHLDTGISNDVIGESITISMLIVSLFIIGPQFRQAIQKYQTSSQENLGSQYYLLQFARIILVLAPFSLIVLIAFGYYYTSINLIEHLMDSYFVIIGWIVLKDVVYRGFRVTSRRLAYRRLQEKRALEQQMSGEENNTDISLNLQDESMEIDQVRDQVLRFNDFFLWILLGGLLYWVWSDLITVAYYLEGVTLWQQTVTTEAGTVLEAVTLLNLLLAIIILIFTYALVRNIGGLLETLVFSRMKFSQGAPYTITTLLTYFLIVIGAGSAFSTLGMSWSKLQWLFAALSVGLGFGLQEIFANFVSGLIILFERPIRIGDMITIGQYTGTVSKIRIRATTLIDPDKKEVIVPNKAFVTERLLNWALSNSITRLVISVGVAYGSDLELVKKLLLQAAQESEKVLQDPKPMVYFLSFGASTLDHELRVYVGQISDRTSTIDFLNRRINQLFAENNIDIAFNQLDVFIKNQDTEVQILSEKINGKNS